MKYTIEIEVPDEESKDISRGLVSEACNDLMLDLDQYTNIAFSVLCTSETGEVVYEEKLPKKQLERKRKHSKSLTKGW